MSWDQNFGSDGGRSPNMQLAFTNPTASSSKTLVPLSADGWEEHKQTIIDLYKTKGLKVNQINEWMRNGKGYLTTEKMVSNRLNKWGIHRYQSSKDKDALCRQLLEDPARGREMLIKDKKQLKKLQRYCKEKPEPTEEDKAVLNLLQGWEIEAAKYPNVSSSTENEDGSKDTDLWYVIDEDSQDFNFSQGSTSQSSPGLGYLSSFSGSIAGELDGQLDINAVLDTAANSSSSEVMTYIPDPIIRQPRNFGNKFMAMEKLLSLCQQYYHIKLQEHSLFQLQELNALAQGAGFGSSSGTLASNNSYNRLFWRKVKNAIYFLKIGNAHLARQEIIEASPMIPILCERHPFSLLQDMHATLSPVNTRIRPALRTYLLHAFRQHALEKLGPNHRFTAICELLCVEEGSDELSTTALQAMLDETRKVLPPNEQELFDLQRTIIRLSRRSRDFSKAEAMARSLITTQESLHGKNHVHSRLALTEWVYILNDQNRYDEALLVARDIVQRGEMDQGHLFPDERDVYAMEDVAEIYHKLGNINNCIDWLRRANKAALGVWGNQTATVHVQDKLEKMHDERYRQVLVTHMP